MTFKKPIYKDVKFLKRVNPNEQAVITFGGEITDVRGPGFSVGFPKLHQVAIVSTEPHRYDASFSALCKSDSFNFDAGFELPVSISVRYRVQDAGIYMESAPYDLDLELDVLLNGQGRERVARDYTWKQIYDNRSLLRGSLEDFLNQEMIAWGVVNESVQLVDVAFPRIVNDAPKMDYEVKVRGPILKAKAEMNKMLSEIKAQTEADVRLITGNAELDLRSRELELQVNYKRREMEIISNLAKELSESIGPELGSMVLLKLYGNQLDSNADNLNPVYDKVKTKMHIEGVGEASEKMGMDPNYALFMDALRELEGFPIMNMGQSNPAQEFKNMFWGDKK
ncbi:hypothetical protein KY334_07680 [Candidatus Woesearchaeota archaeon]|nr:hypothetical protein [Candidatus Woesearchaeota archaeon]